VPSAPIEPGGLLVRTAALDDAIRAGGWRYPLVLKPDVGQRGVGVRKVADAAEARGRILSITNKIFPAVTGDGAGIRSRTWCWRIPVYGCRPPCSWRATKPIVGAGSRRAWCSRSARSVTTRGALCSWMAATCGLLRSRRESIRLRAGFFIGRFDVRYSNVDRFKAGGDLAIIELNGVTVEPTDIYDPRRSVASAYAALFDQWRRLFEIGAANLRRGHEGASLLKLASLGLAHLADRRAFPISS
jgi:hypothetical protein